MDPKAENGGVQEEEVLSWGKSLPVPSVQEMVRTDFKNVPERYIRELRDRPLNTALVSPTPSEIPVINFSLLVNGDEDERKKFDFACKKWGFFQVTNHGVAEEVLQNMQAAMAAFFELPLEEKKKIAIDNDGQGYGQGYVVSEEQKLEWADLVFLITCPQKYKKMKYWPLAVPGFKEAVENYSEALHKMAEAIFANLSLLMGIDKDGLQELHGGMKLGMRVNYYPPCSRPDLVFGVSRHSDQSSITLLLQDDEIPGLHIRHKEIWIPVKPIPNAIVVNIGDVMEVYVSSFIIKSSYYRLLDLCCSGFSCVFYWGWSNGVYKSIEHRAVTNEKVARMSITTFVMPDDKAVMGPVETMAGDCSMYKNIKYGDYLRHSLARKLDGKSNMDILKAGIQSN